MVYVSRIVSVITPVHAAGAGFLSDAYGSLVAQDLPSGWQWEWLVQEDGQGDVLTGKLPDDPRISLGAGRHGGPGVARTLALSRATGDLVKVFDADDLLAPGVLARDIDALTRYPAVGWVTSRVLDLLPDGSTVGFEHDPPDGLVERGLVLRFWREHDYRAPVHPATLCIRRDLLLALGGWMALPASEDTGLLLAASVVADGYFNAEPGLYYRKWPGQATNQEAHTDPREREARMRIILARAQALLASPLALQTTPDRA